MTDRPALTPQQMEDLRSRVADRLSDMESMFDSRCRLTFIMRAPHLPDGDLVVTSDDLESVIKALERLRRYQPVEAP